MVRKCLLPRLQIGCQTKRDLRKKVPSGARKPRFGGETTMLQCDLIVVQEVEGVVKDFWREGRRGWIRHGSSKVRRCQFGAASRDFGSKPTMYSVDVMIFMSRVSAPCFTCTSRWHRVLGARAEYAQFPAGQRPPVHARAPRRVPTRKFNGLLDVITALRSAVVVFQQNSRNARISTKPLLCPYPNKVIVSRQKPRCRTPNRVSHRKPSILSSTSYATSPGLSKPAALSPNHGSHTLESISSPMSSSDLPLISRRGRGLFRILKNHPRITPARYPFVARNLSPSRTRREMVGSRRLVTWYGWNCGAMRKSGKNRRTPSSPSTTSHPWSSLSA